MNLIRGFQVQVVCFFLLKQLYYEKHKKMLLLEPEIGSNSDMSFNDGLLLPWTPFIFYSEADE